MKKIVTILTYVLILGACNQTADFNPGIDSKIASIQNGSTMEAAEIIITKKDISIDYPAKDSEPGDISGDNIPPVTQKKPDINDKTPKDYTQENVVPANGDILF